jgi:hypothetical protein
MSALLRLLRKTRDARKEAAMGKLASAQGRLGQAQVALQLAGLRYHEAQVWRDELLRRNGAGLGRDWRHTLLPSSVAVVQLRAAEAQRTAKELEALQEEVQQCRKALALCEKALLRTDELQDILKTQDAAADRLAEQSQDDDLAIAQGGQRSLVVGSTVWGQ